MTVHQLRWHVGRAKAHRTTSLQMNESDVGIAARALLNASASIVTMDYETFIDRCRKLHAAHLLSAGFEEVGPRSHGAASHMVQVANQQPARDDELIKQDYSKLLG